MTTMFIRKGQATPRKLKEIIIRNIQKLKHEYLLSFAYCFIFGRAPPPFSDVQNISLHLLKMLEKSETNSPKCWFNGDLPWYNHLETITSNKSKLVNGIYHFSRPLGSTKRLNWLNKV